MKLNLRLIVLSLALVCLMTTGVAAFEIITKKDIIQGGVVREDLIKTADNDTREGRMQNRRVDIVVGGL